MSVSHDGRTPGRAWTPAQIKKKQSHIESVLQSKKIPFQMRDIATNEEFRNTMRNKSGQNIPPQIFNDDDYLGVRALCDAALADSGA